jgi:hypothetical protein
MPPGLRPLVARCALSRASWQRRAVCGAAPHSSRAPSASLRDRFATLDLRASAAPSGPLRGQASCLPLVRAAPPGGRSRASPCSPRPAARCLTHRLLPSHTDCSWCLSTEVGVRPTAPAVLSVLRAEASIMVVRPPSVAPRAEGAAPHDARRHRRPGGGWPGQACRHRGPGEGLAWRGVPPPRGGGSGPGACAMPLEASCERRARARSPPARAPFRPGCPRPARASRAGS